MRYLISVGMPFSLFCSSAPDEYQTANSISADYDKLEAFFREMDHYLHQLKIYEREELVMIPELEEAQLEVLVSVLVLFGVGAKYAKTGRFCKSDFASKSRSPLSLFPPSQEGLRLLLQSLSGPIFSKLV